MIPCGKCGADNLIGAIFCRSCGEKLDLDSISPATVSQKNESIGRNIGGIIRRVIGGLVLVVVVGYLVGLFLPAPGAAKGEFDDAESKKLQGVYTNLFRNTGGTKYSLDANQVTWLANHATGLDKKSAVTDTGAQLLPIRLSVNFLKGDQYKIVLHSMAFGKVSVYTTAVGRFEIVETAGEGGAAATKKVTFKPSQVKVGKMTVPQALHPKVLDRVIVLTEEKPELDQIRANIAEISMVDDKVELTMKRTAKRRRAK